MVMTREELQAEIDAEDADTTAEQEENASAEEFETETTQESAEETKTDEAEGEAEEVAEGGEPETADTDKAEVEDWLKGDDHTSQAEKKFTDGDIGKAKAKLKARVKQKDSEIDELRAEIDSLKQTRTAKPETLQRPKREDFYEEDNADEAYDIAFENYLISKTDANRSAASATADTQRVQHEAQQVITQGEDDHYDRAAKLVNASNITPENYQGADLAFKQAIENVIPNAGDSIAAAFVSKLGEGSEKVVYNLGVNSDRREKFAQLLRKDPSGLDAYGYLVELKVQLNSPAKRKTNAPKPPPEVKGDKGQSVLTKQLKQAEKSGDVQAQVNLMKRIRMAKAGA